MQASDDTDSTGVPAGFMLVEAGPALLVPMEGWYVDLFKRSEPDVAIRGRVATVRVSSLSIDTVDDSDEPTGRAHLVRFEDIAKIVLW